MNEVNKLSDKRIIGCIRMDKEPVAADQIIQMENTGAVRNFGKRVILPAIISM